MAALKIRIINKSGNDIPAYATAGSSGMDIRAHLEKPVSMEPLERKLIPTGLFIELPEGYEAQVRPRSGLAFRQGITCLNTPGTIDSDYRGEIQVLLINLSQDVQTIANNERIAQLVICAVEKAEWVITGSIEVTDRGDGGFGHTGKH